MARAQGLAFVYDPDGYWVEIVKRSEDAKIDNEYNLSQARPSGLHLRLCAVCGAADEQWCADDAPDQGPQEVHSLL